MRKNAGFSVVEIAVAMVVGSMVISGSFQLYRSFSASAERERLKADLQRDIITVSEKMEHDIRMSGLGLPGNGVIAFLSDSTSDVLLIYQNSWNTSTKISAAVSGSHTKVFVEDGAAVSQGAWVCIEGSSPLYKKVNRIGMNAAGTDTVYLEDQVGYYVTVAVGSRVYPSSAVSYSINTSGKKTLVRRGNGISVPLSSIIDTINIIPKDSTGNPLLYSATNAVALQVVMGGHAGGPDDPLVADSTEVNIRN